jgi:F0F1-type ATP synthase membrane subunit b/b'
MTDSTPLPSSDKRDALRARIEASERRNAERNIADQARDAANAAVDYTRANPLTVIGGAVAFGLVLGLLSRPGRRAAGKALHGAGDAISGAASSASSGMKSITSSGGSRLGKMIGEAAVAYAMTLLDDILDVAEEGKERAGELGDAAGAKARKLSANASDAAGSAADNTRALALKTRDAALGVVRDIRRQTKG